MVTWMMLGDCYDAGGHKGWPSGTPPVINTDTVLLGPLLDPDSSHTRPRSLSIWDKDKSRMLCIPLQHLSLPQLLVQHGCGGLPGLQRVLQKPRCW